MKEGIHAEDYREVVFQDSVSGTMFKIRSTVKAEKTVQWEDGNEYPLCQLPISAYSHPFFTGEERLVDTEGRVDKFKKKYAKSAAGRTTKK
jgi:large subunit ribosomal protein L31